MLKNRRQENSIFIQRQLLLATGCLNGLVMKTVGHYDNREDALAAMRNWNIKVGNEIDLHPYLERVSPYGYNVTL